MAHICPPVLSVVVGSGAVEMVNLFSAEPLKKKKKKKFFFGLLLIVNLAQSTFLQLNVFVVGNGTVSIINISPPRPFCCCQWCSWNGPHFPNWTFLLLVMVQVA